MKQADKDAMAQQQREVAQLADFNYGHHESSAAVRGEAVAESDLTELIELLRSIRPNYGAVGSRDVDVTAMRKKIDAAITIISARAADAPSEPSGLAKRLRLMASDFNPWTEQHRDLRDAADSLDSQPTVAAQQGSIGDDAQFQALLDNVTQNYGAFLQNTNVHGFMSAVAGLHAYVDHLLNSRAPAAPVAPLAPQTWIATADQMPHQYREVHLKNREGHVRIGRWSLKGGGSWQLACFGSGEQSLWRKDDVTHWCTLAALDVPQQEGSEAGNG